MATYFRVHPDPANRDIFDADSELYDQGFNEVDAEDVQGNDVLITMTPDQYNTIIASRL